MIAFPSTDVQHDGFDKNAKRLSADANSSRTVKSYRWDISWGYTIAFVILHAVSVYGIYELLRGRVQFKTFVCAFALANCTGLGITAGAHRLWSHRTYKARLPLRVLLAAFQTMTMQHSIFRWVLDHRMHHKYTDTDADPHNATRGVFYSHIGWLLLRRHPDVVAKMRRIDMRDVSSDPLVAWQHKYYLWFAPVLTFLLPPMIPYWFWSENFLYSFVTVGILRYMYTAHVTFLVNSAAHVWGTKPYDKDITPVENASVALLALGEGWHNYHHAFPWDYKAAELGNYRMNFTTAFIDACAFLGLAYDLKTADRALVAKRGERTGD